jgi:hypothetical protein
LQRPYAATLQNTIRQINPHCNTLTIICYTTATCPPTTSSPLTSASTPSTRRR